MLINRDDRRFDIEELNEKNSLIIPIYNIERYFTINRFTID